MKSERRHELQENDLAAYLGRLNKTIEPYSRAIIVGVVALFVAVIAFGLYRSRMTESRSEATIRLIQATGGGDPEGLAQVAEDYPNTTAATWARLYEGNRYMAQGLSSLYQDRAEAERLLDQAGTAYRQALAGKADERVLRSRAHFGLARIAEARGNADEAIAEYEAVIEANESEAMIRQARDRIEALSSERTQEFLAWFAEQDFSPAEPSLPPSLPDEAGVPATPDLELPGIGGTLDQAEQPDAADMLQLDPDAADPGTDPETADSEAAETEAAKNEAAEAGTPEEPSPESNADEPPEGDANAADQADGEAEEAAGEATKPGSAGSEPAGDSDAAGDGSDDR
jgi:predicted negative regulator of RcsB-dependent stress response